MNNYEKRITWKSISVYEILLYRRLKWTTCRARRCCLAEENTNVLFKYRHSTFTVALTSADRVADKDPDP